MIFNPETLGHPNPWCDRGGYWDRVRCWQMWWLLKGPAKRRRWWMYNCLHWIKTTTTTKSANCEGVMGNFLRFDCFCIKWTWLSYCLRCSVATVTPPRRQRPEVQGRERGIVSKVKSPSNISVLHSAMEILKKDKITLMVKAAHTLNQWCVCPKVHELTMI